MSDVALRYDRDAGVSKRQMLRLLLNEEVLEDVRTDELLMVPGERLELSHPKAGDFESPASTNSATRATVEDQLV